MALTRNSDDIAQYDTQQIDDKQISSLSDEHLHALSSEEYFQYFGLGSYFKDSLHLCLELQPQNEINFLADYFSRVQQDTSPLILALRFVTIAPPTSSAYMENLAAAYRTLAGTDELTGSTFSALIQQLFPKSRPEFSAVSRVFVSQWMKRQDTISSPITFVEFVAGIVQVQSFIEVFDEALSELRSTKSIKNGTVSLSAANMVIKRFTGYEHNFLQPEVTKSSSTPTYTGSFFLSSDGGSPSKPKTVPKEIQLTLDDVCAGMFLELMKASTNLKLISTT